jgi:hypothetical protein
MLVGMDGKIPVNHVFGKGGMYFPKNKAAIFLGLAPGFLPVFRFYEKRPGKGKGGFNRILHDYTATKVYLS